MRAIDLACEKNKENLYSFYLNLGNRSGFKTGTASSARFISDNTLSWPSYIIGGGKMVKTSLLSIFSQMKDGSLPYFWLRPLHDDPEFEDFASEYGLRKLAVWQGMHLKKTSPFKLLPPGGGLIFEEVKTQQDLRDWLAIVNLELMSESELGISIFLNVLHNPAFRFFRIKCGKKTVSTILMHKRNTETGIYMVSTVLCERNKGLGRWITASAIDLFIADGCSDFVLHATPLGAPLYTKLGFKECCEFGVFRMFGKKTDF